jgi:class 3 adenylate cyclase/pimeloyl-ACP methyl ester carboxylesterase
VEGPPDTRYATNGDVTLAYQVFGEGVPVVWIPGFISHVELAWETPFFSAMFHRLGRFARALVFDKRGTGLSDHAADFGTLEDRMDDVRAVMDAAGFDRAVVCGMSEGGPLAILFAATYPERVDKLVLYGTFASMRGPRARPAIEDLVLHIEQSWGAGEVLSRFAQHAPDAAAARALLARVERYTATPARAAQIMRQIAEIDVRDVLGSVDVPAAVIHSAGDPMIPVASARYLAEHLPRCERFVEIPGAFHASWDPADADRVMDACEEFVTGSITSPAASSERILTTVLFTDIVDSTKRAEELGDARWAAILDAHDAALADEVTKARGRIVKTTGDGALATFDGPARAVRCAQAVQRRAGALGLDVRAAVHTGECELRGDDVAGIAVHVAARILGLSEGGTVLASRTVKDLVAGSGLVFVPAGSHAVKGISEPVDLFAVTG